MTQHASHNLTTLVWQITRKAGRQAGKLLRRHHETRHEKEKEKEGLAEGRDGAKAEVTSKTNERKRARLLHLFTIGQTSDNFSNVLARVSPSYPTHTERQRGREKGKEAQ